MWQPWKRVLLFVILCLLLLQRPILHLCLRLCLCLRLHLHL
jgi:hypothetical protein